MRKLLVLAVAVSIGISSAAIAAEKEKEKEKATAIHQVISFDIDGVFCARCAKVLTNALQKENVAIASLRPNRGVGPVRTSAKIPAKADLGAIAKSINTANTPHKSQSPPGLAVVLSAKLDKESAEKAVEALGKVEGVDAKGSFGGVSGPF